MKILDFLLSHKTRTSMRKKPENRYHAVTIEHELSFACDAVFDQGGKVYLSNEAPMLPLENCTKKATCRCHYKHRHDRRIAQRRRRNIGYKSASAEKERRSLKKDRRKAIGKN